MREFRRDGGGVSSVFLSGARAITWFLLIGISILYIYIYFCSPSAVSLSFSNRRLQSPSCQRNTRLMTESAIWNFFVQIASAVEHVHSRRIVHRGTLVVLLQHSFTPTQTSQWHRDRIKDKSFILSEIQRSFVEWGIRSDTFSWP